MTIPDQLRRWRRARGLSQSQAAPLLGVPVKTLQNWEGGRTKPRGLARAHLLQLLAAPIGMEPLPIQVGHREDLAARFKSCIP